jgi:hypothetical protein
MCAGHIMQCNIVAHRLMTCRIRSHLGKQAPPLLDQQSVLLFFVPDLLLLVSFTSHTGLINDDLSRKRQLHFLKRISWITALDVETYS